MNRRETLQALTGALAVTVLPLQSRELNEENVERILSNAASGKQLTVPAVPDGFFVSRQTVEEMGTYIGYPWKRKPDVFDYLTAEYQKTLGQVGMVESPEVTRKDWKRYVEACGWDTVRIYASHERDGFVVSFRKTGSKGETGRCSPGVLRD